MASPSPAPDTPVADWGRSLLWLNLLATAVVFSARTTEAFELPKTAVVRGMGLALAMGGTAVWAAAADRRRRLALALRELARDPVSLGIAASLAVAAVSTVTATSPRTSFWGAQGSFAGLFSLAAYAVIFFATRSLCRTSDAARVVLQGGVLGLGLSVAYGAVQLAGLDPLRWEAPIVFAGVRRVFSTQGHPNAFAQLLVVGVPLVVLFFARATRARRFGEAALLGLVGTGALGLTVLTLSRAGALALAAAILVMIGGRWRAGLPSRRIVAVLGVVGVIALALATTSELGDGFRALAGRLAGGPAASTGPGELRRFLWAGAWAAFLDHPFLGVGLDCLSLVFGRYRTAAAWSAEWGETPLKAHCQPLEILATRGLLGGGAAVVLVVGVCRAGVRALGAKSREPELALAALAGLAAFMVHISFHFPTAAGTSLAVTLAAIVSVLAQERPTVAGATARVPTGVAIAGVAAAGAILYVLVLLPLRADVLAQAGTVAVRTDPPRAVALERAAVGLDPTRDVLWLRLAAALQAEGLGEAEPAKRRARLGEARGAAEHGVGLVAGNAYNQAHLGTLLADLERESPPLAGRAEVEEAFEKARALDPNNAFILMAAADAALAAGDLERARAWANAAMQYPGFGPPRALLGATALVEGRRLAATGPTAQAEARWSEAARLLREGLAGDWHGDDGSRAAAEANLASVLTRAGPSPGASPQD
jgi:O-antigen ligase